MFHLKKNNVFSYVKNVMVYKHSKKATINCIRNTKMFVYTFFLYTLIRELVGGGNYNWPPGTFPWGFLCCF